MYLHDNDDMAEGCKHSLNPPANSVPRAEEAIRTTIHEPNIETRHQATNRVIVRYRAALKSIQASELERLYNRLPELDERSRQVIHESADRLVAKMLHSPLQSLHDEFVNGSQHGLLASLEKLFQLNDKQQLRDV